MILSRRNTKHSKLSSGQTQGLVYRGRGQRRECCSCRVCMGGDPTSIRVRLFQNIESSPSWLQYKHPFSLCYDCAQARYEDPEIVGTGTGSGFWTHHTPCYPPDCLVCNNVGTGTPSSITGDPSTVTVTISGITNASGENRSCTDDVGGAGPGCYDENPPLFPPDCSGLNGEYTLDYLGCEEANKVVWETTREGAFCGGQIAVIVRLTLSSSNVALDPPYVGATIYGKLEMILQGGEDFPLTWVRWIIQDQEIYCNANYREGGGFDQLELDDATATNPSQAIGGCCNVTNATAEITDYSLNPFPLSDQGERPNCSYLSSPRILDYVKCYSAEEAEQLTVTSYDYPIAFTCTGNEDRVTEYAAEFDIASSPACFCLSTLKVRLFLAGPYQGHSDQGGHGKYNNASLYYAFYDTLDRVVAYFRWISLPETADPGTGSGQCLNSLGAIQTSRQLEEDTFGLILNWACDLTNPREGSSFDLCCKNYLALMDQMTWETHGGTYTCFLDDETGERTCEQVP